MRVLIIDPEPETGVGALDLSMRARAHGHDVRFFLRETERNKHVGKGLINRVGGEVTRHIDWADLIFNADNTKYIRDLSRAKASGKMVLSANENTAQWELHRGTGMEVFKKAGIKVPDYKLFNKYDDAINYVKKEKRRFVSKPNNDADKSLSYCAKSPSDMVYMLERWKKMDKLKGDFFLQEFQSGAEMAVGGWFGPGGFNTGFCENFEFKKLMNDDLGCATGEMGTVLRYVQTSKLAEKVLLPIVPALEKEDYCGHIDVNCIIDEDGNPWPLEFTTRPGWPTFNIQTELHEGDPVEWMAALAQGEDLKRFILNKVAVGVVLAIPDFPYSHATSKEVVGIPIYNATSSVWPHIHPCAMMMGMAPMEIEGEIVNAPCPCTAGDYIMIVTAHADTVVEAREKVYRKIKRLEIPNNLMYRTDIGVRLRPQLLKLHPHGYAKGLFYK